MTEQELQALKATMPWTQRSYQTPKGQVIFQMIDNRGQEVPLFSMLDFLEIVTTKMAMKEGGNAKQAATNEA